MDRLIGVLYILSPSTEKWGYFSTLSNHQLGEGQFKSLGELDLETESNKDLISDSHMEKSKGESLAGALKRRL